MTSDEPSPGTGILRHPAREGGWEPPAEGDAKTRTALDEHIARHFGTVAFVWHEIVSDLVHIDVNVIEPSAGRPWYTLVASGMSDLPMTVPDGADDSAYAELVFCLPAGWPMSRDGLRDEAAYWPIRVLKTVARLPHEYRTWIGPWHSVPNGDPAEPYAPGTPFVGVLVAPMLNCAPEARTVTTGTGTEVSLLALVPLHPAEMDLKLSEGTDGLIDAFDRHGVSEVFEPGRPSSV